MGFCLSKCLPDGDMAAELEAELDESNHSYLPQSTGQSTFGTTSLLAADEVVCLDVIGEGPLGVIYKGSYRGSAVAVKKMKMISLPSKPSARENIEMELEVEATRMGSLRHPNTVLFMGACLQEDYFCIVSEYCTRGSLFNVLHAPKASVSNKSRHKRPELEVLPRSASASILGASDVVIKKKVNLKWSLRIRLALGAARGLLYLHSADPPLVHGQLKSTNILVDDSWNAKLADFGTRRVADAVGFDRSRMNTIDERSALLRWTAPELLKLGEERVLKGAFPNDCSIPQAVDIFSFGLIMWELTTGELPYADMHSNIEISSYVLSGFRPIMKPGRCNIKWAELMARCWSHNPSKRPSAAEIVSSLESISKIDAIAQSTKKVTGVVNSNRADYRFAEKKSSSRSKGPSKFKSNVRAVV
ncbi:tkl protein kinase [Plasmopara halstedii]|uniref:Tkl protein kinase n=1 Tax=Plasmopara halstedii TaxID=4781 RepID=A0A0P1A774_PLAHL|nr:tkl protein kinase [Plasmopara halstedii]CEG35837.1 tkl protein kinase [Plasmopara halstedii]|eukprot:XP_024572206.1 tkl protein kinase [Plasmopara halstedii]